MNEYKLGEISKGILNIIEQYKKTDFYKNDILKERKDSIKDFLNKLQEAKNKIILCEKDARKNKDFEEALGYRTSLTIIQNFERTLK